MRSDSEQPHDTDVKVGQRIRSRREQLGFTQTDLAKAIGLTFQQVQKYERASNRVSASKLFDIAVFLKCEIGFFFDEIEGVPVEFADVMMDRHGRQVSSGWKNVPNQAKIAIAMLVETFGNPARVNAG